VADELKITGLDDTIAALRALPAALSGKNGGPIRKALFAAAKPFRDEARQRVRHRTWNLHDNIIIRRDRNPAASGAAERYTVTMRTRRRKYAHSRVNKRLQRAGTRFADWGNAYYGKFLEFGTSRMPAYPFLRPTFENKKTSAVDVFAASLHQDVAAAVELAKRVGSR